MVGYNWVFIQVSILRVTPETSLALFYVGSYNKRRYTMVTTFDFKKQAEPVHLWNSRADSAKFWREKNTTKNKLEKSCF